MNTEHTSPTRTQYWQDQVAAWQASGQSQLSFCKTHELNYPRFVYWLRKYRRQQSAPLPPRSGFVPVVSASLDGGLTVRLPNGIELHGVADHNIGIVERLLSRL